MNYIPLNKLYYGDEMIYKHTYQKRFESDNTVKLDFEVAGRQAFFQQCEEVMKITMEILRMNLNVKLLVLSLPGKASEQYSKKCLIDEIVLSNKIEGVNSSRREIGEVLDELESQSSEKGKKKRFDGIVNKYYKLMTHETVPLDTCEDFRTLYDELVLDEVIAENQNNRPDGKIFRKDLSEVKSVTDRVIHKGVYPEAKIIESMEKALSFLHDESIEVLFRICIFHYLLEYIHPFYDGNGRLGRFIVSYYLSEELEPLMAYRLSETIKQNIRAYYQAFETCNDPHNLGDLTPFLLMMLEMIRTSIEELQHSLERKRVRLDRYRELIPYLPEAKDPQMVKLYDVLIQAALFSENGIPNKELVPFMRQSSTTVRNKLRMVPAALLVTNTSGHEKLYSMDLKLLDEILLRQVESNTES